MTTKKYCDLCNREAPYEYIDGKTVFGPWANMCPECFPKAGIGLGLGRGQRYTREDVDEEWTKVDG